MKIFIRPQQTFVGLEHVFYLPRRLEDEKLLRWRRFQDMSSRYLQGILETKKWRYLYLKNLNGYVSNKSIFHKSITDKSKANPKSSIRTEWIQIQHYRTGEAVKTKF